MTWRIKICGITSPEDARAAADAGADAIGLNFHAASKRYVELSRARSIVSVLPSTLVKVGLFVNAEVAAIRAAHELIGLDFLQLHGDEPPEFLQALSDAGVKLPVMRALPCGADPSPVGQYLDRCRDLGCSPARVLLDAAETGQRGGTGITCDWTTAAAYHTLLNAPPLVLAGGLTPDNVAAAIAAVQPAAVDVASGVESSPGQKDVKLIYQFIAAARAAFGVR